MFGPTARPSAKDYSPLLLEERIDDDVDSPGNDTEEEYEEHFNTPAPLLSARTRGNEPPRPEAKACWYHKLFRRNPRSHRSGSSHRHDLGSRGWVAPSKERNWWKISFFTTLGLLLATTLGLGLSTGLLARDLSDTRNSCSRYRQVPYQTTRMPMNQAWRSSNYRLNFPHIYPPLEVTPSSACQAAWNTLIYVPCHEKIWNRSWDNGKHNSLFEPDIGLYAQAICQPACVHEISRAFQIISSQCTEEDKFNMIEYTGAFMADPGLEDGPVGVISTIAKRVTHMCREEPNTDSRYYWSRTSYCSANMWEDWFIVDGMNAGNLEGLDRFESRTQVPRAEHATWKSQHMVEDVCDNRPQYGGSRHVEARRFGPGKNETTCGWCTMNWFQRKLLAWKKDEIVDPKNQRLLTLPDYLERIRHVGQRCESGAWDRVWTAALKKYKASGELPRDWDGNEHGLGH